MNKWYITAIAALTVATSALAAGVILPDGAKQQRRERTARPTVKAAPMKAPIISGTKQLYGAGHSYSYFGIFAGDGINNPGPAAIDNAGNHKHIDGAPNVDIQAGCYFEGKLLAFKSSAFSSDVTMTTYDTKTWASGGDITYTGTEIPAMPVDVTYDPETRRIYGVFFENYNKSLTCPLFFGYIDPMNVSLSGPTKIATLDFEARGIAANADGEIFIVGNDQHIYKADKNTGALTSVVEYNLPIYNADDEDASDPFEPLSRGFDCAEIDYDNPSVIYFSYVDSENEGFIATISLTDGSSKWIYNSSSFSGGNEYSELIPTIWFEQDANRAASTPAQVSNVAVGRIGIELTAMVKFNLPAADVTGQPLTGTLGWSVSTSGTELASGSGEPGSEQIATITAAEAGMLRLDVVATSGAEKSAPVTVTSFIGPDTPVLAGLPETMADGRNVTVYWNEPYAANDGNLGALTYKVVRSDNKVVAEATAELEVVDAVESEIKTVYTYTVTPIAGPVAGEAKTSRPLYVGDVFELPFADDFTDAVLFAQYPAVDANKDGNTWSVQADKGRAVYFSSEKSANDYLLIGPFDMVAGNSYEFEMTAGGHNRPETVAVYVVSGVDLSGKTQLIAPLVCNPSIRDENPTASYKPATSGRYYFAIQACSDPNSSNLYIYNVKIKGTSHLAPAAIADAKGTPGPNDYTVSGTLPAKTADGAAAAGITSVVVYRDGEKLAEITDNVADGAAFTYTDASEATNGRHIYSIVAVNAAGEGVPARIEGWRGPDTPSRPTNLHIYEDVNIPGIIHFTMDAPKIGINGGYIDPNDLTYYVDYMSMQIPEGVINAGKKPQFELQLKNVTSPTQISCSVYATNSHGNSGKEGWTTKSVYVGPTSALPLRESWPNGTQKSGLWIGYPTNDESDVFNAMWAATQGLSSGIKPQDKDDYMLTFNAVADNSEYSVLTPRFSVAGTVNPTLIFYWCYTAEAAEFSLDALIEDQPLTTVKKFTIEPGNHTTWVREEISLEQFKDKKYVQLAFTGKAKFAANDVICIDNVSIIDLKQNDLTLVGGSTDKKLMPGEEFEVTVNVRNSGVNSIDGEEYSVVLRIGDREVARNNGVEIAPDKTATFTLGYTPSVVDMDDTQFTAEIEFASDMNLNDNIWTSAPIAVERNDYPAPRRLTAVGNTGVMLEWLSPDMALAPDQTVTETFDNREAFSLTDFGDFTTYDGDGAPTSVIATALGQCNYPNVGKPMAWQIMNPGQTVIVDGAWYARSGTQFAAAFQANFAGTGEKESDDWLISPELTGRSQKIRFYARAGARPYSPELLDFKYSTSDNQPESFKDLEAGIEVPYAADWVEYNFTLPEGTKYFALIHKSYHKLALLVDDITYAPAGSKPVDLKLAGYNIYRDGVKLNNRPFSGNFYTDTTAEDGKEYTYRVSAVWNLGESETSNSATVTADAGIVNIDAEPATIKISAAAGAIIVSGAAGLEVNVYTPAGAKVISTKAGSDSVKLNVAHGIYVVRAGTATAKVSVR